MTRKDLHPAWIVAAAHDAATSRATIDLPLPDFPVARGDLYAQAVVPLGANARASHGLRIQIR